MIWKRLRRRYTRDMEEDPKKIADKLEELQKATGHKWTPLNGYHAITRVEMKDGNYEFLPASGMPVKVFADLVTGEVRPFLSFIFEVDKT